MTDARPNAQQGFTLVVIAALFMAFAVIAAVAVERNTTVQLITRRDATADQLNRLSTAIIEYSVFNRADINLYPCPASLHLQPTDADFGKSVSTCWDTTGDSAPSTTSLGSTVAGAPPYPLDILAGTDSDILRGMVPVQNLSDYGISVNDAFDPWGDRIIYILNRKQAYGSPSPHTAPLYNQYNPTITDHITSQNIVQPDFILISVGRDGVGGIKRSNPSPSAPDIGCGATSDIRFANCDINRAFIQSPSATYSNVAPVDYFDDILTYYRQ